MSAPMAYQWTGEGFEPLPRFRGEANKRFVVGQNYILDEIEERSGASHRHYFAAINEAWANLPEGLSEAYPSPEHLRKYALIRCGYYDRQSFVAASKREAMHLRAFLAPIDDFAIITVEGATVTRYTAKSQSLKAMGKEAFADSKDKVLAYLDHLLGLEPGALEKNARAA